MGESNRLIPFDPEACHSPYIIDAQASSSIGAQASDIVGPPKKYEGDTRTSQAALRIGSHVGTSSNQTGRVGHDRIFLHQPIIFSARRGFDPTREQPCFFHSPRMGAFLLA